MAGATAAALMIGPKYGLQMNQLGAQMNKLLQTISSLTNNSS